MFIFQCLDCGTESRIFRGQLMTDAARVSCETDETDVIVDYL